MTLLLADFVSKAQDLSGTWEGSGGGEYLKLVIVQFGDSCFGYTYDTQKRCCKANFSGKYNEASKKLAGQGLDFIEKSPLESLYVFDLNYYENEGTAYLKGKFRSKTAGSNILLAFRKNITLCKRSSFVDSTRFMAKKAILYKNKKEQYVIKKKNDLLTDTSLAKTIDELTNIQHIKESRISKLIQTIETTTYSIRLVLYDDGEIDGDTVTVFDNGKMIVSRLRLSTKPFEILIPIDKMRNFHTIELMANNLGSIPPNTAYMQIYTDSKMYELRVSTDLSVNARVDFKYKDSN